jgi:hypothetical protein
MKDGNCIAGAAFSVSSIKLTEADGIVKQRVEHINMFSENARL